MLTDWILIARLARELDQRVRGARVAGAGMLADGRVALSLRSRGCACVLAVDLFASPPLVTLEAGETAVAIEPGFSRALDATLRGMVVTRVRARRGDRLIALDFAARSRFGVGDEAELYLELVPRFGNAVLVKRATTVAALKEFSPAENSRRTVQAGMPYELPPLPVRGSQPGSDGPERVPDDQPLYVYRRNGDVVAANPAPLAAHADDAMERVASLLEVFAEVRAQRIGRGERERVERRRAALLKRLDARERKLEGERTALEAKRRRIEGRDAMRAEGERIFATLHERAESERDEAKERAAELFASYKKLGASSPHLERRARVVGAALEAVEALRWECERATAPDLDDVEAAVAHVEPQRGSAKPAGAAGRKRKRAPLEIRTASGSRILVGRNPVENADLTFRVARPNDLWFHAQGIPGAHVVLARDDRTPPSDEDVERAAALAAFYSKARASAKVPVDYTLRKHVRRQQDAPPGLVWYTQPTTIYARPRSEAAP
jgi:predicted ribosome quality control (RQC) complex YloA/Tae2 family protein